MKFLTFFLCLCCLSVSVRAACPEGDFIRDKKGMSDALQYYYICALNENDDETQLMLAQAFRRGSGSLKSSQNKALFFFHLAADNGNAPAQVELAQMLLKLDETPQGREVVKAHVRKMDAAFGAVGGLFKGELLHPYALLMLAAENENQKWYYPTTQKSALSATLLLKDYAIDDVKKKTVLRQASEWKQRKMLETARDVMSSEDYKKFQSAVFPKNGTVDGFARSQAVADLQDAIKTYLE